MASATIIPIKPRITSENKCNFCTGSTCCTYLTQEIETPRSIYDFETMLWQVSHQHVQIYKEDGAWYLLVNTRCGHLLPDGRCNIYEHRPQICREHSNDGCEFEGPAGAGDFDLYFPDYEALLAYCRRRFKGWDRRFGKSPGAGNKRKRS